MVQPILEMQKISKRFPGVIALDSVDLSIGAGEIVALAGENGAGKSTLMKILGGIYQPDEGTINIDGVPVRIGSVSDARNFGIGFVHQELNVVDNLSATENVFLGREPRVFGFLVDRKKIEKDARSYLDRLGLDLPPSTPLTEMSIAQQQLVEIAKALSQNARILILDEPTSSLTLSETERLLKLVLGLKEQGVSIIYISHRLGEIGHIADRVVVLRDGKNAGRLERGEIEHEAIVRLMVGRDIVKEERKARSSGDVPAAEIDGLVTSRYPQQKISFEVRKGEILGIAGLVGSGRSEAAQAIFGVDPAVSFSIKLDGKQVPIANVRDAIDNGIYLIPEDRRTAGLILDMPIRANISLPSLWKMSSAGLISSGRERRTAADMCDKLNVKAPSSESLVMNLSGGNQQKVVLAKWLSLEPRLLIFDEPTRGIDVGAKAEIYQLMRDLAASGVAIIMISSDMEEVLSESDRIAVMHEGRITGIMARAEASEEAIMRLAVGGER